MEKCVKCGSDKVIPLAGIADQTRYGEENLRAYVFSNPDAWVFKGTVYAKLKAQICGQCGHTELIAENPKELYDAYQQSLGIHFK